MSARTVRVRIAVAVDPDGGWSAWGGSGVKDHVSMSYATDGVGEGEARHWVEADLPVPESHTVQGVVTQDGA